MPIFCPFNGNISRKSFLLHLAAIRSRRNRLGSEMLSLSSGKLSGETERYWANPSLSAMIHASTSRMATLKMNPFGNSERHTMPNQSLPRSFGVGQASRSVTSRLVMPCEAASRSFSAFSLNRPFPCVTTGCPAASATNGYRSARSANSRITAARVGASSTKDKKVKGCGITSSQKGLPAHRPSSATALQREKALLPSLFALSPMVPT